MQHQNYFVHLSTLSSANLYIYIINMKINKVLMIAASFAFITARGAG